MLLSAFMLPRRRVKHGFWLTQNYTFRGKYGQSDKVYGTQDYGVLYILYVGDKNVQSIRFRKGVMQSSFIRETQMKP